MITIRYVTNEDKRFWFELDKHLPEAEFEKKVRDRQYAKETSIVYKIRWILFQKL